MSRGVTSESENGYETRQIAPREPSADVRCELLQNSGYQVGYPQAVFDLFRPCRRDVGTRRNPRNSGGFELVGRKGFEPLTPCASCRCASQLRQRPVED